jgi:hypothetical protein
MNCCYNRYVEFKSIVRCQTVHLVDRSDLFKISNFVYNGRETVRSLYCSLQGQTDRRFMVGVVTQQDRCLSKLMMDQGTFGTTDVNFDSFWTS